MRTKSRDSKCKGDSTSLWSWREGKLSKRTKNNPFTITDFLQRTQESVLGPGAGAGVGCGVGLGFGFVGGLGYGGSAWNHLKLVFGFGFGCGVGLGVGYGQGFGYGYPLESLDSYLSKQSSDSGKRGLIEI